MGNCPCAGGNGHDLELILEKGGLKSFELRDATGGLQPTGKRPWERGWDSSQAVKLFGQSFVDGTSLFEIVVVLVLGISVSVCQGFYRDDGTRTTEGVPCDLFAIPCVYLSFSYVYLPFNCVYLPFNCVYLSFSYVYLVFNYVLIIQ